MTEEVEFRPTPWEVHQHRFSRQYRGGLTSDEMEEFARTESIRVVRGVPPIDVLGLSAKPYYSLKRSQIQTVEGVYDAVSRSIFPRIMGVKHLSETIGKYNQFATERNMSTLDLDEALKRHQKSRGLA